MSRLSQSLTPAVPQGMEIPELLERAWTWMESQGWGRETAHGTVLTPYAGTRQLGMVFTSFQSLDGWFAPGEPGYDRLMPIAEGAGDGTQVVLWRDDDGAVRFGALGGGGAFLLADSAVDFLRLVAIGYPEIPFAFFLSMEPDDEEAVEAHAAFRAWVETELGVDVPPHWEPAEPDPFAAWVEQIRG